jgi:hypothetical protein
MLADVFLASTSIVTLGYFFSNAFLKVTVVSGG